MNHWSTVYFWTSIQSDWLSCLSPLLSHWLIFISWFPLLSHWPTVTSSGGIGEGLGRKGQQSVPQAELERQQILQEMKKKTNLTTDNSWIRQRSSSTTTSKDPTASPIRRYSSWGLTGAPLAWGWWISTIQCVCWMIGVKPASMALLEGTLPGTHLGVHIRRAPHDFDNSK